jgi:hypothetical protein
MYTQVVLILCCGYDVVIRSVQSVALLSKISIGSPVRSGYNDSRSC